MYQHLLVPLALQKPPDGEVVWVKPLSEILSVTGDIDKHKCSHCGFDGAMSFWDNR